MSKTKSRKSRKSKTMGEKIRRARMAKGWNQSQLSNRANISQPRLSDIEKGKHYPNSVTIEKLQQHIQI